MEKRKAILELPPVLIISCDKYSYLWPFLMDLYQKYWPEQKKIYIISEFVDFEDRPFLHVLKVGDKSKGQQNWSDNLIEALERIPEETIVVMLDDFFIRKKVDQEIISHLLKVFWETEDCRCLRLVPHPPGGKKMGNSEILEHVDLQYRISTQAGIWNKSYLMSIVKSGESPWQFEHEASRRSIGMKGKVFTVGSWNSSPIKYINSVIRGLFTRDAISLVKKEGLQYEIKVPIMTMCENYYWLKASKIERHLIDFMRHRFGLLR